jgi:hypothetical protein
VGNIQFGYRLCGDGKHVEPDPAEQAVLDKIRNLRLGGKTLRGIAAALNHSGHRTRRGSTCGWSTWHESRSRSPLGAGQRVCSRATQPKGLKTKRAFSPARKSQLT